MHLNLFAGYYERMMLLYPDTGAAVFIRRVVRRFIEQIEAKGDASVNASVEINI